ncbi:general secretion pathway protein B [Thalassolituus maritimus]|uniref:General secretion pathway protein B n=1 Tax=Thalassolituus maritimus TaxID=484498 RepID=A0A1N7Q620_9GAMM|nr:general secretion pathway protein GspB [Thalassolituus maritimus]SIT18169.1 general secretion pathway protein B [Thalassolituus maritimus]
MSYILDALKKSEQERDERNPAQMPPKKGLISESAETGKVASEHEQQRNTDSNTSARMGISAALAVVLILGAIATAFYSSPADKQGATPSAGEETSLSETDSEPAAVMTTAELPDTQIVAADNAGKDIEAEQSDVEPKAPLKEARAPFEALERIPDLNITGHTFSSVPAKRTVTMNDRVWREGEQVVDGVVLKEITRDGILLDVSGWPVVIGRTRGWKAIR